MQFASDIHSSARACDQGRSSSESLVVALRSGLVDGEQRTLVAAGDDVHDVLGGIGQLWLPAASAVLAKALGHR